MGLFERLDTWMTGGPEEETRPETRARRADGEAIAPGSAERLGMGRVVLTSPGRYVDTGRIADLLCQGYTVLLDLEEISKDEARRIVDFLSGCAYGKDGQMLHIAHNAYLLAPDGVDILDFTAERPLEEGAWTYGGTFGF